MIFFKVALIDHFMVKLMFWHWQERRDKWNIGLESNCNRFYWRDLYRWLPTWNLAGGGLLSPPPPPTIKMWFYSRRSKKGHPATLPFLMGSGGWYLFNGISCKSLVMKDPRLFSSFFKSKVTTWTFACHMKLFCRCISLAFFLFQCCQLCTFWREKDYLQFAKQNIVRKY